MAAPVYVPAPPWTGATFATPVDVNDTANGQAYIATGPMQLKHPGASGITMTPANVINNNDGTHTVIDADGDSAIICDTPVKTVTLNPASAGAIDNTDPQNPIIQIPHPLDPDQVTLVNAVGDNMTANQGANAKSFCVQEPMQVCIEGAYEGAPKNYQIKESGLFLGRIRALGNGLRVSTLGINQNATPVDLTRRAEFEITNDTCEQIRLQFSFGGNFNVDIHSDAEYLIQVHFRNGTSETVPIKQRMRGVSMGAVSQPPLLSDIQLGQTVDTGFMPGVTRQFELWLSIRHLSGTINALDTVGTPHAYVSFMGGRVDHRTELTVGP